VRIISLIALLCVPSSCVDTLDFKVRILGEQRQVHLCKAYADKLVLVVNTASRCAFTPQYDGLEALYTRYQADGLVVLGFPSNDFAGQEPGTEKEISNFCRLTYNVKFPMFEKVHAAQAQASPLYQKLASLAGEYPGWNFHKYLIAPDGKLLGSFKSHIRPDNPDLVAMIEQHLPETTDDE